MLDYRDVEDRAVAAQAKADKIKAKGTLSEAEADEVFNLELNATSLEAMAADLRRREQAELRDIVANGRPLTGVGAGEVRSFLNYLRTGEPVDASLSTTDANGGYVVPEPIHQRIVEKVRAVDPIFRLATHFDISGGDATTVIPYKSAHGVAVGATETGARSEQNAPEFAGPTITAYDIYTDQRATQQVLDSVTDLEEMLVGWIVEDCLDQFGIDIAVGNGSTKAKGLFAASDQYTLVASGNASAIANTNFISLFTALHPKYRANAAWLMNSATFATVLGFSHPAATGYDPLVKWDGGQPMILGKPVYEATSAPNVGSNAYPVAFGDVGQAYAIVEHRKPTVLRDPFTQAPKVRFYGLSRLGGAPWDPQACLLLKVATSV